jgi:hypothetical protein
MDRTVTYRVSLEAHRQHVVRVRMEIPAPDTELRLAMPAWTPGSYKVREYARVVEGVEASAAGGGEALLTRKLDKQTWGIGAGDARRRCLPLRGGRARPAGAGGAGGGAGGLVRRHGACA